MKGRRVTLLAFLGVVLIAFVVTAFTKFVAPVATVTGRVTNAGKPVAGQILFSPQAQTPENTGPSVLARLDDDGGYKLELKTTGLHSVVVNPRNLPDNLVPMFKLARWRNVKPGPNVIDIVIRLRKNRKP
jgi:hypothetical protein